MENSVILPTNLAQSQGVTALDEIAAIMKERYREPFSSTTEPAYHAPVSDSEREFAVDVFTREEIAIEIRKQDSSKACGSDGIHTRLLKALLDSTFLDLLYHLYKRCLQTGRTPAAWNKADIYMLIKDPGKQRDANNVRPITLICMFRKIFERLLLQRFEAPGWASLHPAQAGFRSHYSTCMNAAVVHSLLVTKQRSTAVFLDFRSAFDVVGHFKLAQLLNKRGCPRYLQSVIGSLMFSNVKSRVLVNGTVSDWFSRTRGVLQGSPLSPCLFNIFIDSLLELLNDGVDGVPTCLFYADDGVLLTRWFVDVQMLLDKVYCWSIENGIEVNVKKCGHISSRFKPPTLFLAGEEIPFLQTYDYLGFPMTARGIDFEVHLQRRLDAACKRTRWLSLYSDSWGPAHRLRIYKQYLAPMFEYGAPLVHAWASETSVHDKIFKAATAESFKCLMAWIAHSSGSRWGVTANLCGLLPLRDRFHQMAILYQLVLSFIDVSNPLQQVFDSLRTRNNGTAFTFCLSNDREWMLFKKLVKPGLDSKTMKTELQKHLKEWALSKLQVACLTADLTALIPLYSRKVRGLFGADVSLSAPMPAQEMLFQYRHGLFLWNRSCACNLNARFGRGHETCHALPYPVRLSKAERLTKALMREQLMQQGCLVEEGKFTDVDFLLNTGQIITAASILRAVKEHLGKVYSDLQKEIPDPVSQ